MNQIRQRYFFLISCLVLGVSLSFGSAGDAHAQNCANGQCGMPGSNIPDLDSLFPPSQPRCTGPNCNLGGNGGNRGGNIGGPGGTHGFAQCPPGGCGQGNQNGGGCSSGGGGGGGGRGIGGIVRGGNAGGLFGLGRGQPGWRNTARSIAAGLGGGVIGGGLFGGRDDDKDDDKDDNSSDAEAAAKVIPTPSTPSASTSAPAEEVEDDKVSEVPQAGKSKSNYEF